MANSVTTNPWIIDTAGAGLVWTGNIEVLNFEFQEYTADTDVVTVKNKAGDIIWSGNGAADLSVVRSGYLGWIFGGLAVTALTTGKLRVYHK